MRDQKVLSYRQVWRDAGEVRTAVFDYISDITITSGNNVGSQDKPSGIRA